jgi:hypothetical protein
VGLERLVHPRLLIDLVLSLLRALVPARLPFLEASEVLALLAFIPWAFLRAVSKPVLVITRILRAVLRLALVVVAALKTLGVAVLLILVIVARVLTFARLVGRLPRIRFRLLFEEMLVLLAVDGARGLVEVDC